MVRDWIQGRHSAGQRDRRAAAPKEWKADSHRIDLLYFLPDSKTLFVGPVDSPGTVWDVSGTPTLRATLPVAFGGIAVCAASPDGKQVVVAGDDTVIRWYDTATWQKTREYSGFLLETFAMAFTPDGKQLLAGGADARLTIFDAASGKVLRQFGPEDGASVIDIKLLDKGERAATLYMDDAGAKPPHALAGSALAKAVEYMTHRWSKAVLFLDDARIPLDDNAAERAPCAGSSSGANHYGSKSRRGTEVAAVFYSLIESAKLAGVEPAAYLERAARLALDGGDPPLPHEIARA